jgi:hypothetical protein
VRVLVHVAVASLLLAGCTAGLDPATIVKTPRILAIVADHPESAPGTDVAMTAMISVPADAPRPLSLRWSACIDIAGTLDAQGFQVPPDSPIPRDCNEEILAEDEAFVIDGARTATVAAILGAPIPGLDQFDLPAVLATAGFPFFVDLEVRDADGTVLVSGYKRIAITTRATPTTNPPPPAFAVGDDIRAGATVVPFVCADPTMPMPIVLAGTQLVLQPILPPGEEEESWLESFPIYDYSGGVTEARENAYYSWFATAGAIGAGTTRPPERKSLWEVPMEPGPQSIWLVVRDGHLGTSACRLDLMVFAPPT